MPALYTVLFPSVNGLPEDTVVHDFVLPGVTPAAIGSAIDCADLISAFYNDLPAGGSLQPGAYLSDSITRAADGVIIKAYDLDGFLDGSPHGAPFLTVTWTLVASADTNQLPHEVACCITMEAAGRNGQPVETADGADAGSLRDRPMQRYTGRVYFGPLNISAVDSTGSQARPADDFTADLRLATRELAIAVATETGASLGVWSRVDETIREVASCSTDNAWDTQRRRGVAATSRTRQVF